MFKMWSNIPSYRTVPAALNWSNGKVQNTQKNTPIILPLGVEEWRKVYPDHEKLGKKAVLFIMTDDTKNCDDVAEYLENTYPEFKDAVLVIHTNNNGEISESGAKKSKEGTGKTPQRVQSDRYLGK